MEAPNPREYMSVHLSPITRKEKRNLLIASTISLLVSHAGLVPTKMAALGVDFSLSNQHALMIIFALVIAYYFVAFAISGMLDFVMWRKDRHAYLASVYREPTYWNQERDEPMDDGLDENIATSGWSPRKVRIFANLRALFEFAFPSLLGIYAIYAIYAIIRLLK